MAANEYFEAFKSRVEALGGTVPPDAVYVNVHTPVHVFCAKDHDCWPPPASLQQGRGLCKICGGSNTPDSAWANFKAGVEKQGGTVLETKWLGSGKVHHVLCPAGHDCYIRPNQTQRGDRICGTCAGVVSPAEAEANFRAALAAANVTLLEPFWLGGKTPHRIRCAAGHETQIQPESVQRGNNVCENCHHGSSVFAWEAFKATVEFQSGKVLEPKWLGSNTPHLVVCSKGHESRITPGNTSRGRGICHVCAGKVWDALYVVTGLPGVKFGITSGDPRTRLKNHWRDGYTRVERLFTTLPDGVARALENKIALALKDNGFKPVLRREYFAIEALPLVLRIVDEALGPYEELAA